MLRRLNQIGVARLGEFLDAVARDSSLPAPRHLLIDSETSEDIGVEVEIEDRPFANRFDIAHYLFNALSSAGLDDIEGDRGLWAWLALFFFEQLCPPDKHGRRKPGERARWIPAIGGFRKYYRHLLVGPFRIHKAHRDDPARAMALLCTPLSQPGDIVEQLASRQELVTNNAVMGTATKLYIDPETNTPKRGAAGRSRGSVRRLAEVLNQFDITWDLYAMSADDLLVMLPHEFDRFGK